MTAFTENLRNSIDKDLKSISNSFNDLGRQLNAFQKTAENSLKNTKVFTFLKQDFEKFKVRLNSGGKALQESLLTLDDDIAKTAISGVKSFKSLSNASSQLSKAATNSDKLKIALKGIGAASGNAVLGLLSLSGAVVTLGSLGTVALKAYDSFKELQGVSKTLTFAEAITGSDRLAANFELVDATSNSLINGLRLLGSAALNDGTFDKYAQQGVSAFSRVETAAFRLNTILVQGSERSIDKIDSTIKSMRELQKATNFAVDSVTLLNTQYDIASGGFTSQRQIEQVGIAGTNLATAGFGDQVESTNALIKVLRAFGDSSDEAEKRAAQLFETTKVGITTLPELSGYIGPLAAQAKALGLDFSEVTAALANLTTQGLSTAEASTALTNLLDELAANSDQAKEALAGFVDESGKTIQLGAGQLKEKGLAGVLKGIQDATKGQLPALQKIFSSSTAQTGAQLLINSGIDNLAANASQIKNVDTSKLSQEAQDRAKTLEGAFSQAFNKSQVQVEEFGQAISSSVLDRLAESSILLNSIGTGTASFLGGIAGSFDVLTDKVSAIGGFIATAFSTIVPIVFFNKILAFLPKVASGIKSAFENTSGLELNFKNLFEGITIIARKAFDRIAAEVKAGLDKASKEVAKFVAQTKQELAKLEAGVDIDVPTPDNVSTTAETTQKATQTVEAVLETSSAKQGLQELAEASQSTNTSIVKASTTASSSVQALGTEAVKGSGKFASLGKISKLAFGGIVSSIKTAVLSLGTFALAGAAIAGVFQIAAGWATVIGQRLDERTNPAIAELSSSLKEIENNRALAKLVEDIDNSSTKLTESNFGLAVAQDLVTRLGGAWNTVTGATASYEQFLQRSLEAQDILAKSIEKTNELASKGRFEGRTAEARTAQSKLDRGLNLNAEDINALTAENEENILEIKTLIAQKQEQINQFQAKGNKDPRELEALEKELKLLKDQGKAQEDVIKKRLNKVKANQLSSELINLNTDIPLSIQLQQQGIRQVTGEIDFLKEKFAEAFSADNIDPEALNAIFPQLQSTLGAIQVQVKADPNAALQSLQDLQKIPNFDKLIFGDLNFRKAFSEAFSAVTNEVVTSATTLENVFNTTLQSVSSSFSNVPEITIAVNSNAIDSINAQVQALTAELNNQATPYARQLELLGQIEQLEAKRTEAATSSAIASELAIRQQVLTATESLLQAEQARINLLTQEDKFATGLITAAKAKTQAAETELSLRKEQLSIAAKEEQIRKQQGIQAIEARISRVQGTSLNTGENKPGTSLVSSPVSIEQTQVDIIKSTYDSQKTKIDETYERQKALIEETYNKQKEVIAQNEADARSTINDTSLSISQQNDIATQLKRAVESAGFAGKSAIKNTDFDLGKAILFGNDRSRREALFNEQGELREPEKIKELLQRLSERGADQRAIVAIKDIFNQDKIDKFEQTGGDLNRFKNEREAAASQRKSSLEALNQITESQKQAAAAKQVEENKLKASLEAAKKDLELSTALSQAKISLETFSNVVALSEARINEEFAAREKTIQQNQLLADSFSKIASSSSFTDSSTAIDLAGIALTLSDPLGVVIKDAEKAFAQLNAKIEIQEQALSEARSALSQAEAAGASKEQLAPLRQRVAKEEELLASSKAEVPLDQAFILIKTAADKVAATLQISEQKLQEEFAARDKIIKQSEQVSTSLSNLSSNASSLFTSSAIGASLSALSTEARNPELQASVNTQKELAQVDIRARSLRQLADEAGAAVKEGIRSGLPEAALNKLIENRDRAEEQAANAENSAAVDKEVIRQRGILDSLSASLEKFNSKVQEVNAVLTTQGQLFKDTINLFVQSQKDIADSNNAVRSADQGFLSIFGSNNPFTEILQRRNDADRIRESGVIQQTEAIAAAQQEFIDLTVLDQQLSLEQQGYENALTQTQLLSDLVKISQGQEAEFSRPGGQVTDFLSRLPQIFEQNAQLTDRRRAITQEQLTRIQPRLEQRLQNIQLETSGNLLSNAAGSADPRLIAEALSTFRAVRPDASIRQLDDPSRRNLSSEFQAISNSFNQTRESLMSSSSRALDTSRNNTVSANTASQGIVLNAQIPINITNQGGNGFRSDNSESLRATVNSAVQSGLNQIAQRVARK